MILYHFMDEQYGVKNLENKRIKVSTFNRINDPFELQNIWTNDLMKRRALEQTKRTVTSNYGVLCFSKSWSNPVQWSHYANKHQGICIELEFSSALAPQKVDYIP